MEETQVWSLGQDPLEWQRREWQPTPVFLPGEVHGQRNLAGNSPCGHNKSDTTERLTLSLFFHVPTYLLSFIYLFYYLSPLYLISIHPSTIYLSIYHLSPITGEGHGTPLQCSCLEKPMDRGVWWLQSPGPQESDPTQWLSHHHHLYLSKSFQGWRNVSVFVFLVCLFVHYAHFL